jgi:probable O-glycosylation ligase (exosortase A-associated)
MRDILLILIVLGFASVAFVRPFVGVLLFTWLGFFYPQSYTWGFGKTFPFSQVAAMATIGGCLFSRETKRFPITRESILLLCLWAVFGFSSLFAIFPDRAADKLIYVSKILLMVCLTMSLLKDRSRLEMLLRVIALSIGFIGIKGALFVLATGGENMIWGPAGSFLEANNSIGLAMAMNIPLLYYLSKVETRPWLRKIMIGMLWGSFPAIICTYSRGAWLGLVMVAGLLFLRIKHKFLVFSAVGLMALIGAGTLSQFLPERLFTRYEQLENYQEEDSAQSRFWNWEFCKRVALARPLTGGGFDFPSWRLYPQYFPEFVARWGEYKTWSCHSSWFTMFGEHGFPGIILWLSLLFSCFASLRSMRAYGKVIPEYSWVVSFSDAIQAALAAYLIVGSFIDANYFDMFYYLVAMITCAKEIVRVAYRDQALKILTTSTPLMESRVPARALTR